MTAVPECEVLAVDRGPGAVAALRDLARNHHAARGAAHVSRSYRPPLAVVAWHSARVGVDVERLEPMGRDFADSICTPSERVQLDSQLDDDEIVASLWCAKEALAKVLGDAVDYDPRRLEAPLLWKQGSCGRWRARTVEVPAGHICWLVWQV